MKMSKQINGKFEYYSRLSTIGLINEFTKSIQSENLTRFRLLFFPFHRKRILFQQRISAPKILQTEVDRYCNPIQIL